VGRGADRFAELPLRTEGYALALAAAHPLAGGVEIAAERLAGEVMIVRRHCEARSDTSRFFTERGVCPHFALRSTNDERVLQMVAAGLGLTVMPVCYGAEGVRLCQNVSRRPQRQPSGAEAKRRRASVRGNHPRSECVRGVEDIEGQDR
jgi:DNA-binding transcriptional LysR family regulator